jgi:hypothetical protein
VAASTRLCLIQPRQVFEVLDCLLAFVESGMPVPGDILDIMREIMEQDEANKK